METKTKEKRGLAAIFALCPRRHVLLLVSAGLIALHLALRGRHELMVLLSEKVVRPLHRVLGSLNAHVPFSVAELLLALAATAALVYIIYQIAMLLRRGEKGRRLYRTLITLVSGGLTVYALFCLLWGVYYYADDFAARSGFVNEPVSTEQLASVTRYFARGANRYGALIARDENGLCASDRAEIIRKSPEVFAETEKDYPALAGPALAAKGIVCSRVMSYLDFTGFFFPFTAEANVNMDSPRCDLAATVAHELSHQRGVAREQEANFTAVLASLRYGDADYCYSACLLAYTHLGNALYRADHAAWEEIRAELSEDVVRDLSARSAYWRQFETPVQKASNTVYESFLHSYDQTLGLNSYGACVDLLVNYYYELSLEQSSP
ncbi:MAG: DUF3810 domain-containing protein [Oscillospiraceae bacterium]|nr:DUF3810 domain-containing protein [Oscillospiraceae bacterium]